jgi:hypothetical protein
VRDGAARPPRARASACGARRRHRSLRGNARGRRRGGRRQDAARARASRR